MRKHQYQFFVVVLFGTFILSITNVNAKTVNDYQVGDLIKFNPIYNNICSTGDTCYDFFVISKENSSMDIMMKENIVNDVYWASSEDVKKLGCTSQDYGCSYYGPVSLLPVLKQVTENWNTDYISATKNVNITLPNHSNSTSTYTIDYTKYRARIITADEILKLCGGSANISNNSCPSWLTSTVNNSKGFWTSTGINDDRAYYFALGKGGYLNAYYLNYTKSGIRPVVTINNRNLSDDTSITNNGVSIKANYQQIDKINKFSATLYDASNTKYNKFKELFSNYNKFVAYNIEALDKSGNVINFDKNIEVSLKIPDDYDSTRISVWYVDDSFNKQELDMETVNNVVTFNTNHFSDYIITEDKETKEIVKVENTGFNVTKIEISIGLGILAFGIIIIVQTILKNKKINNVESIKNEK